MLDSIIKGFMSSDFSEQEHAEESLREFSKQELSLEDGIKLLQAAANQFPKRKLDFADSSSDLIYTTRKSLHGEYIYIIQENFASYSKNGKGAALSLLTEFSTRDAAKTFMQLMRTYARHEEISHLHLSTRNRQLQQSEIFFPEILEYLDVEGFRFEILLFLLAHLQKGSLDTKIFSKHFIKIEEDYRALEIKLSAMQQENGISWMWEDHYQELRNDASLLLDIIGHFPDDVSNRFLRSAIQYTDPRLSYFAITGLLRKHEAIEQTYIDKVAVSSETRNWLYDFLLQIGKQELFPAKFKTQESFAESDIVGWLIYPTELGRVPDEIELMHIGTFDDKTYNGLVDYFVFRFRTLPPHWAAKDGWIAGVSGPFLQKEEPTTNSLGGTFSQFDAWDSRSPEDHLGEVRGTLIKWREHWRQNHE